MKFLRALWSAMGMISLSFAMFLTGISAVQAAAVPWKKEKIHYSVESKPLKDVLRDFAASQGIAASIAPNVDGIVSGKFNMSPQAFLNALSSTFGFVWFYDGTLLDISASSDIKSTLLTMRYGTTDDLRNALTRMDLVEKRYPIVYDDVQQTAMVSGPQHYMQLVSNVAQNVDNNAGKDTGTQVRIFKLRHASATDRIVTISGGAVNVPGVASVLQSLFGNGRSANAQTLLSPSIVRANSMLDVDGRMPNNVVNFGNNTLLPPLPGGYTGGGPINDQMSQLFPGTPSLPGIGGAPTVGGNMSASAPISPSGRVVTNPSDSMLPIIKADGRTNSVLIRDVPSRMSQYQPLIEELDIKPRLIEIQATMIEIDSDALDQIGIDWRAHNSHGDLQTGDGNQSQNGYNGNLNPTFGTLPNQGTSALLATPAGISLTAVLGDAGRYLLARVNALTKTNQARIEASPKVTTLDNIEAVMDNSQQMFVPVTGYAGGNLYNLSTGVSLRVLPMVVEEAGSTQIKLEVNIENGQFSQSPTMSSTNLIPVAINTSQIKTQAFVTQGQSLLIAGYQKKQDEKGVSGIPLLSKIPFLGALFRYNTDIKTRKEQLFLLSPRVLDL